MSKRDKKQANPANAIKTGADVLSVVRKNSHRNPTVTVRTGGNHQWFVQGVGRDGQHVAFPISDHPQPMAKGTRGATLKKLIALGLLVCVFIVGCWALLSGVLGWAIL